MSPTPLDTLLAEAVAFDLDAMAAEMAASSAAVLSDVVRPFTVQRKRHTSRRRRRGRAR